MVTEIWQGRNDELHRHGQENEAIQRTAMDAEIARLHCSPSELPAEDQHYCNHPLAYILRKPPTYKRRWLHRVRLAIERKKQDQTHQPRLTDFFNRAPTRSSGVHTVHHDPQLTRQQCTQHQRRPIQTTQQLLTEFFRERAPNTNNPSQKPTRPPPH